jgi:hypothetical protein
MRGKQLLQILVAILGGQIIDNEVAFGKNGSVHSAARSTVTDSAPTHTQLSHAKPHVVIMDA